MKTVFLAGGVGKRMAPLKRSKCLLPFLGETLIHRHLRLASKAGLEDFIIVANPANKEPIAKALKDYASSSEIVIQRKPRGMGNAILQTKKLVSGAPLLIVGADEIFDSEAYQKIIDAKEEGADSLILAEKVETYFPGGYLLMERGNIKGIVEKPGEGNEPSSLVNVIMHYHTHSHKLFKLIEAVETKRDDEYERAMDRMMKEMTFKAVSYSGWKAIKYPWHILGVMDHFLGKINEEKIASNVEISDKATIDGPVWIEEGSKVLEGAVIRGPSYIGKDVLIGNNSLVRSAHLCDETVVGFGSEVKHSYISEGTFIHDSYVGDSVLDENCNLGAGTVLANWRFDEQEVKVTVQGNEVNTHLEKLGAFLGPSCKTGVNSSTMPGVKMGKGSRLGPNLALNRDLQEKEVLLKGPD